MEKKPFRILCAVSRLSPCRWSYHYSILEAEPLFKNDIVEIHPGCVKNVNFSISSLDNLSTMNLTSKTKRQ
jgi:hypothetical protein